MKGWLQKILTPPAAQQGTGRQVPARRRPGALPATPFKQGFNPVQGLPNATVIYGIGASLMFVATFFLLLRGRWFPALIVLAIGACLLGFALHLLKHQD